MNSWSNMTDQFFARLARVFVVASLAAIASVAAMAQNITTVAGWGVGDGGPATSAGLSYPSGVAVDAGGNLYIADRYNGRIRKVTPAGVITTVAGNGTFGFSGDNGPATSAGLYLPSGVAVDASGNLYIADTANNRTRKVTPAGVITTVAGNGTSGFSGDNGPATSAGLNGPVGVAVDTGGNLYIADHGNDRIRKVTPAGVITTVAGNGTFGFSGDNGPATSASLGSPSGVAVDASGNLYIADQYRIRKVTPAGVITTVAGNGTSGFGGDNGPATSAGLSSPSGVAVDTGGNLYIADAGNDRIRKVTPAGVITTVAGNGTPGFSGDNGPATSAQLLLPVGVAVDAGGNLYIADRFNARIRKVTPAGVITTVAGNGDHGFSGDNGPATSASLSNPSGVAVDTGGSLYIADRFNNRIRKVTPAGVITTVAGIGTFGGFSGDNGPATSAGLSYPSGVAVDAGGNLYIADAGNNRIRKVTPAGVITTVAGIGTSGFSGDNGPATSASLGPVGVAVDTGGNLYIADRENDRIRKVTPAGVITTVAGNGTGGFSGDNGPATSAQLSLPAGVAVDAGDNLHIADTYNHRIRKVLTGISLDPSSLDFGGQSLYTTSPVRTITVTNNTAGNVTVYSVGTSAGGPFSKTHDCGTLNPGATCTIQIAFTPYAVGAATGVLGMGYQAAGGSIGNVDVGLTGTGERSLVTHYYRSILRRAPDAPGKAFWEAEAARMQGLQANVNETWYSMAMSFYFGAEYAIFNRNNSEFVTDLYSTFFNRAPDSEGFAFWTQQLASGMPREGVLASFMFSPEFALFTQAIFGNTAARGEINVVMDFYRGLLSRLPDTAGFNFYVGQFRTAQCQGAGAVYTQVENISSGYANSQEYSNRGRSTTQYVADLYNSFLRRGPDLSGLQFWVNQITSGARTREAVRQEFKVSPEFDGRVQAVIAAGCAGLNYSG